MFIKRKILFTLVIGIIAGLLALAAGCNDQQATAIGIFLMSIAGVIIFWEFRLSFVFFGAALMLITHTIDLVSLIKFSSLEVIFFLIGMMIMVAMLKEAGFFLWLINRLLTIKNITGKKLFLFIMTISAILSGLMDEASSIIIMTKVILELTDFLEIDPIPLLIPAILATNIGSSATVLGNPIGVFIASKGGFTFEDFIRHALPITLIVLGVVIAILMFWYRNYIKILDEKLKNFRQNTFFLSLITVPPDRHTKIGMAMFVVTLLGISLHRRLEILFLLTENTLLFIIPLVAAGIVMIYNRDKARQYVDNEVEWTSLLFFMFLFAEAGAMEYCGVGGFFTHKLAGLLQQGRELFLGIILFSSGLLSSILDNTVVVASYVPLMETLQKTDPAAKNLWWAVLFGACYGGNITVIGSTANIIAMSILEKNKKIKVNFFVWLKIGLVVGLVSMGIAFGIMVFLPNYK